MTATGGKVLNVAQLRSELDARGVSVDTLFLTGEILLTSDSQGQPVDFPAGQQGTVTQAIAEHTALRDRTDQEYSSEFQASGTQPSRKQEIRDIMAGLLPREQVAI
jgi:hypothetical protein